MKIFIGKLLAKTLDKMNFTVIIGCKPQGELTCLRNTQFYYGNSFADTKLFYENGQEFELPEGEFTIKSVYDNESNKYITWFSKIINKKIKEGNN